MTPNIGDKVVYVPTVKREHLSPAWRRRTVTPLTPKILDALRRAGLLVRDEDGAGPPTEDVDAQS